MEVAGRQELTSTPLRRGIPVALLLRQPELALKLVATEADSFTPWGTSRRVRRGQEATFRKVRSAIPGYSWQSE
jgi:hypothetical protein